MKNGKLEELITLEELLSGDTFYKAPINPYVLKRIEEERKEREKAGIINLRTGDGSLHQLSDAEKIRVLEKLSEIDLNYLPDDKNTSIRKYNFRVEKNIHRVGHELMSGYARKYFLPSGTLKLFQSTLEGDEEGKFIYKTKISTGIFYLDDDSTEEKESIILSIEYDRWREFERQQQEVNIQELFTEMLDRQLKLDYEKLLCKEIFNRNWKGMSQKNQKFIIDHIRSVSEGILLRNQMQILEEFLTNGVQFAKLQDNPKRTAQATRTVLKRISKRINEKIKYWFYSPKRAYFCLK